MTTQVGAPVSSAWKGLTTPLSGFRFLARNQQLWRYAILPAIFNLVMTAVAVAIVLGSAWYWWSRWMPWFVEDQQGAALWVWTAVTIAVGLFVVLVAFVIAVVVWRLALVIVCGSLYGQLAEQTERILGMDEGDMHVILWSEGVVDDLHDLAAWIGHQTFSLAVAFVPLIGPIVAFCLSAHSTFLQLGLDYLQYPLTLRGQRREQRWSFARRYRTPTLALGVSVFVIEWIPIVSSILLPSAVVGGVLLHRQLIDVRTNSDKHEC